jgi:uncharacterized protein (DUF433 family)
MSAGETPAIQKTPNVCGGAARVRRTRIAVWMLVLDWKLGMTDAQILDAHPDLTTADLEAVWNYYRANPVEIERAIRLNDTAGNVPAGAKPPAWIVVSARMLGLSDDEIREAFEPPLSTADLDAAWATYRTDPQQIGRDATVHRLAG